MSDRDISDELQNKNAEMFRQQELGTKSDDRLEGYDKAEADSFPASDPPAKSEGIIGVGGPKS